MKNRKLPTSKQFDRIVENAFSSDVKHNFSVDYEIRKEAIQRGTSMKKRNRTIQWKSIGMTAAAAAQGGTLDAVYEAQSGGQVVGYAINVEASGSQGIISMMVGIDTDGAVTGVSIVTNAETSGIGSKVMGNEPLANGTGVLDQFIGKSAADGTLAVGTNVDAITGATVSSKGVTTGVNTALAAAGAIG